MKIYNILFFLLCSLVLSVAAFAQTVAIDAEYRPRAEVRQGFKKPLVDTLDYNAVILQRTRLNADYKSNSLNAHLTLQDARIWGQSDTKSSSPQISVYEAWVEMLLTSGLSLEAGRQSLKYDDQRLLAASNWSNTGNAHDALLLKYKDSFLQAHAGFAYNNTNDTNFTYKYNVSGMYQTMGFIWLSKEILSGLNLSVIGIGEGLPRSMVSTGTLKVKTAKDSSSTMTFGRFTYGGNLVYQNDASLFGGTLTGYVQSGKDAKMGTLSAYFFAAKGTAKILDELSVAAGLDYYSGTSNTDTVGVGTTISYTFNKLYGTNHSFNGSMEYWTTLPSGGLFDYYAGTTYKFNKDFSMDLTGHLFSLAQSMYTPNKVGASYMLLDQKNLGSELDLTVNYQWSKEVAIQGGYSRYFTTSTTTLYTSITTSTYSPQWAYVMLTVKPTFFKSAN
jgi:hypothetical protein